MLCFASMAFTMALDDSKSKPCTEYTELMKVDKIVVMQSKGKDLIYFQAGMAVDADGSPRAYHPKDTGLDALANAGHEGNWWGIATSNGKSNGMPIIQDSTGPAPGYYVSTTGPLFDSKYKESDARRYINSEEIPYMALPPELTKKSGIRKGDLGMAYNTSNGKSSYAIYADGGPADKLGEGSMKLAAALGLNNSPRKGGTNDKVILYFVFPGSGNEKPPSVSEIDSIGNAKWTGLSGQLLLDSCLLKKKLK